MAPGATDAHVPYTGTWNAATRTATISITGDRIYPGTFTVDFSAPPPVFPMSVVASIGPVFSNASATLQFRPADVGRTGGVYAFAAAPTTLVQGLSEKSVFLGNNKADTPCVLAQVNQAGNLVAVSLAQMQALVFGVFSAQGASATILNNVRTSAIAGATFYVGYGSSATSMMNEGVFRNAFLVPGSGTCPPLPYQTALWWNPAESGWGLNLNHQGSTVFATLFTYDASRAPMWLVMSGGVLQSDGRTFTGDLYRTTGPAFNANPFTPIGPGNVTTVGSMSITFADANAGTLRYTVNGTEVVKTIQRQVYGTRAAVCLPTTESRSGSAHYQDLWWNASESGWGLNVTHQDNTFFATLFTYDADGRGMWLVMSGGTRQADGSYLGDLYRTSGPAFNAIPFTPIGAGDVTQVGTMRLRFTDGNAATLTYTVNGVSVTKSVTRQVFSTPVSACN